MTNFKLQIIINLTRIKLNKLLYKGRWETLRLKKWKQKQRELLNSVFYRELATQNSPLVDYPIVDKKIFMSQFDALNTVGIKLNEAFEVAKSAEESRNFSPTINGVTVGLSSGTSGNRGVFLATEKERAKWVAAVLDRVVGFKLRKRKVAFFLRANSNLYTSVNSKILQFEFFDLRIDLPQHIDRLNHLQPNILVAQPSMLLQLVKAQENGDLKISPEKIISVAEVLYDKDRKYMETVMEQTIHQVYQCTEGFLASTCKNGTLHFNEDFFTIERKYIDQEKTRFHPVITDLERNSQLVIRYELNDIIREKKSCDCGCKWIAVEAIEGRSDDILELYDENGKKKTIFPDFFRRAIITASDEINEYALIQQNKAKVELFIDGPDHAYAKACRAIKDLVKKYGVDKIEIEQIQSTKTTKGNKLRRIRNEYGKKH